MRKSFLLGAALAVGLSAQTARADVYTDINFDKYVAVDIAELIVKVKLVGIAVIVTNQPDYFAESQVVFNQLQDNNHACTNCDEKIDQIINSGNGNTGILSLNQGGGNMINQGTTISIAFVDTSGNFGVGGPTTPTLAAVPAADEGGGPPPRDPTGLAFAESQVNGDQKVTNSSVHTINILFRTANVIDSINNNSGIAAFNQGTGNILNQQNAISIAAAVADGVALSDATLGQQVSNTSTTEYAVRKDVTALRSMNGNSGIVQGNQSVGNFGNQSNIVSISAVGIQ